MKVTGKDGYLYDVKFGPVLVGGAGVTVPKDGFYKIQSCASTGSGIPGVDPAKKGERGLKAGDFYFARKDQEVAEGDSLIPMNLTKVSFVTDVGASAQGQVFDVTTQIDVERGARAYVASVFKERSGTINGYFDVGSLAQQELINEFNAVITDDGTHISLKPAQSGTHHFMLSRRETITEGEVEAWEYFPVVIESFQTDKPIEGVCPFNFNYRVDGTHNPGIYYRTVEAA
ncbi:MAG: hypothetical protein LBH44_07700 [Treponema sp.]|jgi:hypothetical protein|nr:hypothetical protein [Treponema sp.]